VSSLTKNSRYFTVKIYRQYLTFITTCYDRHGHLQVVLSVQMIGNGNSVRKPNCPCVSLPTVAVTFV